MKKLFTFLVMCFLAGGVLARVDTLTDMQIAAGKKAMAELTCCEQLSIIRTQESLDSLFRASEQAAAEHQARVTCGIRSITYGALAIWGWCYVDRNYTFINFATAIFTIKACLYFREAIE